MSGRTYAFVDINTLNKFDGGLKDLSALPSITAAQKAKLENQIKFIQKVRDYGPYYEYNWQKFLLIPSEYYAGSIEKPEIPALLEYTDTIVSDATSTETTEGQPIITEPASEQVLEGTESESTITGGEQPADTERAYADKLAEYRNKKIDYFKTNKEKYVINPMVNTDEAFRKRYMYYQSRNRYDDIINRYDPTGVEWIKANAPAALQEIWDYAIAKRNGDRVSAAVDCLNMLAQSGARVGEYANIDAIIIFFFACLEMYNDKSMKFSDEAEALFVYYYKKLKGCILDKAEMELAIAGMNIAADMKEGIRIADAIAIASEYSPDILRKLNTAWIYTSSLVKAATDNPYLFYITFCDKFGGIDTFEDYLKLLDELLGPETGDRLLKLFHGMNEDAWKALNKVLENIRNMRDKFQKNIIDNKVLYGLPIFMSSSPSTVTGPSNNGQPAGPGTPTDTPTGPNNTGQNTGQNTGPNTQTGTPSPGGTPVTTTTGGTSNTTGGESTPVVPSTDGGADTLVTQTPVTTTSDGTNETGGGAELINPDLSSLTAMWIAALAEPSPIGELIATGATVIALALIALSNSNHYKTILKGLFEHAREHISFIASSSPEDPDNNHHKTELKAALDRMERIAKKYLKGNTQKNMLNWINKARIWLR